MLIAVYAAMIAMVGSAFALGWPWYLVPLVGAGIYALLFYPAYTLLKQYFRR
ncbi:hypothetical protein [Deinococcus navajonensis]|uniref:Uncharacterized protein n=1 Tax=Deinococcus navajonensis TaxID=309884 RepID=A0ABV8XK73_9DEIO